MNSICLSISCIHVCCISCLSLFNFSCHLTGACVTIATVIQRCVIIMCYSLTVEQAIFEVYVSTCIWHIKRYMMDVRLALVSSHSILHCRLDCICICKSILRGACKCYGSAAVPWIWKKRRGRPCSGSSATNRVGIKSKVALAELWRLWICVQQLVVAHMYQPFLVTILLK